MCSYRPPHPCVSSNKKMWFHIPNVSLSESSWIQYIENSCWAGSINNYQTLLNPQKASVNPNLHASWFASSRIAGVQIHTMVLPSLGLVDHIEEVLINGLPLIFQVKILIISSFWVVCPCGLAEHIFLLLTSISPLTNDICWSHLSMIHIEVTYQQDREVFGLKISPSSNLKIYIFNQYEATPVSSGMKKLKKY